MTEYETEGVFHCEVGCVELGLGAHCSCTIEAEL